MVIVVAERAIELSVNALVIELAGKDTVEVAVNAPTVSCPADVDAR